MKVYLRNPTKFFNNKKIRVLKQFIQMLQNEVTLNKDVKITFEDTDSKAPMTTGVRLPNHDIRILAKNRILVELRPFCVKSVDELSIFRIFSINL